MIPLAASNFGPVEVVVILFLVAVVLSLFRVVGRTRDRLNSRPCPRCGRRVPAGELECDSCDFDFRSVGA